MYRIDGPDREEELHVRVPEMISALARHLACTTMAGHWILLAAIVVVAALANLTALQRAVHTVRQLS